MLNRETPQASALITCPTDITRYFPPDLDKELEGDTEAVMLCCLLQQTLQQVPWISSAPAGAVKLGAANSLSVPLLSPGDALLGTVGTGTVGCPKPQHSPARAALPAEHPTHCQFRAHSNLNYNYTYKYTDYNYLCYK